MKYSAFDLVGLVVVSAVVGYVSGTIVGARNATKMEETANYSAAPVCASEYSTVHIGEPVSKRLEFFCLDGQRYVVAPRGYDVELLP